MSHQTAFRLGLLPRAWEFDLCCGLRITFSEINTMKPIPIYQYHTTEKQLGAAQAAEVFGFSLAIERGRIVIM